MKTRAAKFVVALIASILSSASAFAAPEEAEQRQDTCLTSPREYSPPGARWRYRTERGTGRHCWFLKDDAEKTASKAAEPAAVAEEAAPTSRKKPAKARTVSDARAEFSQVAVEPETRAEPAPSAPAASAPAADSNQPSTVRSANMLAPAAATRWPDPMSTTNSAANPPAAPTAPADQSAEVRTPPAAATTPAKQQAMPRAVPPMPLSEKPMSLPMLITVSAGALSVLAVLVSMLFAWRSSRAARLSPSAPMPPLEMPDQQLRPGDLYRERQRRRTHRGGRRAA